MRKTSSRLLTLLSLLQTPRDWSGSELAQRLDVTARTVRRDVDRLRELGYPIRALKGPAGGYRLAAGTHLPPLLFDDAQAIALTVALQTAASEGTPLADDAARTLATLRQVLPPRLRQRVDLVQATAVRPSDSGAQAPVDGQTLADISRAVRAGEELRFDYVQDPGALTGQPRRVEPHHLVIWHGRWYLVAWDLDRADWRTFRADRIRPRTPAGPRFTPRALPGGDVSDFVTGRFRGTDGTTTAWPCRGEVILRRPAAEVAAFAGDAVVEPVAADRCRLTLGSWSWTGLAAAIARFDADIEAVTPPELAAAFARIATRFATAAEGGTGRP
ncbi:helix-turn-helix transcriptional regulator [Yinghuangia soli]|uniref:WYL domain-containing protein n=1 Tax=Yinghuangia soli TaxID=2908204 RepID=A0AA41PYM1_9ACTN|nr:WYL domain-containing protein [Yinghuangia soli]MCF2527229.1 WYL domain-containing protein [Yinghuangia soli]